MLNIFELSKAIYLAKSNNRIIGNEEDANTGNSNSSSIIICGHENCGKTMMIIRFMDKNVDISKTISLDFNYITRLKNNMKELCTIWEIGGGIDMLNLIKTPITKDNIENCSLFIFVDLSMPSEIPSLLLKTIQISEEQINLILNDIKANDSERYEKIKPRLNKINQHKDSHVIQTLYIPIMIVLSRYDQFQNYENEKKKNLYKFIRFFAHINHASIVTIIPNNESTLTRLKTIMFNFAFNNGKISLQNAKDVTNPMVIQAGTDCLESIELLNIEPPKSYQNALIQWKNTFEHYFLQNEKTKKKIVNFNNDNQFAEYEIDTVVEQRQRELESFIREKRNQSIIKTKTNNL